MEADIRSRSGSGVGQSEACKMRPCKSLIVVSTRQCLQAPQRRLMTMRPNAHASCIAYANTGLRVTATADSPAQTKPLHPAGSPGPGSPKHIACSIHADVAIAECRRQREEGGVHSRDCSQRRALHISVQCNLLRHIATSLRLHERHTCDVLLGWCCEGRPDTRHGTPVRTCGGVPAP